MRERVFRTRRQWNNLAAWSWIVPVVVLVTAVVGLQTGRFLPLLIAILLGVAGMGVAAFRDMYARCSYRIRDDKLILCDRRSERVITVPEMMDASPLDRLAARDFITQRAKALGDKAGAVRMVREFLRYCTVDIGVRSFSLGLGRRMIDRMPRARHDLVLLRLKNGSAVLLSPVHVQDMAHTIGRLLQEAHSPGP